MPIVAILDDDEFLREALVDGLGSFGYEVVSTGCAEWLFAFIASTVISCLLLDYELPGTNGLEVQARLRQEGLTVPVIFLSASADPKVSSAAMEAGAAAFLHKPAHLAEIDLAIRERLSSGRDTAT